MDREQKLAMLREVRDIAASAVSLLRESKYADASQESYDRMYLLTNTLSAYTADAQVAA